MDTIICTTSKKSKFGNLAILLSPLLLRLSKEGGIWGREVKLGLMVRWEVILGSRRGRGWEVKQEWRKRTRKRRMWLRRSGSGCWLAGTVHKSHWPLSQPRNTNKRRHWCSWLAARTTSNCHWRSWRGYNDNWLEHWRIGI